MKKINIEYIVDNNSLKWGHNLERIPIRSPTALRNNNKPIVISSDTYQDEIYEQLIRMGFNPDAIIKLY